MNWVRRMGKSAQPSNRFTAQALKWAFVVLVALPGIAWLLWIVDAVRRGLGVVPYRSDWGIDQFPIADLALVVFLVITVIGVGLGSWIYERLQERGARRPRRRRGSARLDAAPLPAPGPAGALVADPLPPGSRRFLRARCDHYVRLPVELRGEFDRQVHVFLSSKRIAGVEIEVTAPMRLLVAASAVMLTVGWPGFEWTRLSEVLLYPRDFDADYRFDSPERAGQAHQWGIILLSVPSLRKSFDDPTDGYHAGVHEFMHLLDVEGGEFDGIPAGFTLAHTAAWDRIRCREEKRLWQGRSVLDPYGLTNRVEFLAVTAEAFFETPVLLRERHRQLYDMLAAYFRQDPAAWEGARRRSSR